MVSVCTAWSCCWQDHRKRNRGRYNVRFLDNLPRLNVSYAMPSTTSAWRGRYDSLLYHTRFWTPMVPNKIGTLRTTAWRSAPSTTMEKSWQCGPTFVHDRLPSMDS